MGRAGLCGKGHGSQSLLASYSPSVVKHHWFLLRSSTVQLVVRQLCSSMLPVRFLQAMQSCAHQSLPSRPLCSLPSLLPASISILMNLNLLNTTPQFPLLGGINPVSRISILYLFPWHLLILRETHHQLWRSQRKHISPVHLPEVIRFPI